MKETHDPTNFFNSEESRFLNQKRFERRISKMVTEDGFGFLEAIVDFCEENELDVEDVTTLLSPYLKTKLEEEATKNNMLKRPNSQTEFVPNSLF